MIFDPIISTAEERNTKCIKSELQINDQLNRTENVAMESGLHLLSSSASAVPATLTNEPQSQSQTIARAVSSVSMGSSSSGLRQWKNPKLESQILWCFVRDGEFLCQYLF